MKKTACLLFILALLTGFLAWQLSRWKEQTSTQRASAEEQLERLETFLSKEPELRINEAAEQALAYRPEDPESEGLYEYQSPEGIRFISHSNKWDETMLKELYEELLRNRHGEELNTLDRVTVHAESDDYAAATHRNTYRSFPMAIHFPLVPEQELINFLVEGGQIVLYGGDKRSSVEAMASDLSHEYGHHYTMHYMLPSHGSYMDLQREYAKLRGLNTENTYYKRDDEDFYYRNHHRYLVEIAAEDYVVLMGSPNAMKKTGKYVDVRRALSGQYGDMVILRNAAPQENMLLPFATQVPGLADYFYSFLGEPAPEYPQVGDVHLKIERQTESYHLDTGYKTFVSYKITWDKTEGEDVLYTLLCLDDENEWFTPVVTAEKGEYAQAEIGEVSVSRAGRVTMYDDGIAQGTKRFLVVVTYPDGRVGVSDSVEKSF